MAENEPLAVSSPASNLDRHHFSIGVGKLAMACHAGLLVAVGMDSRGFILSIWI
jgi:hypothetical protein